MMNVTLVGPAQPGFITVFPGGGDRPNASNLNYTAGQAPTPNLVDATLSSSGQLAFYASAGPVNLIADITSYTTGARLSTSDLAQNRWDHDRAKPVTVTVGSSPLGVAFDGTNIWVANVGSNNVSKINPTTPMIKIAMMMFFTFKLFHSSQTQKPMPTPPVNISAATMTSQAVPTAKRTPVSM
jgi:hypothetical protein